MKENKMNQGAVLITGASRGLGKSIALKLSEIGYKVFAGIRNPKDGDTLKGDNSNDIIPVLLDVTNPDNISDAFNKIEAEVGAEGLLNKLRLKKLRSNFGLMCLV
jgi:NAD(P)-dependent dehydrogenase (short-subunit alcohol dehydrogenase family)